MTFGSLRLLLTGEIKAERSKEHVLIKQLGISRTGFRQVTCLLSLNIESLSNEKCYLISEFAK